MNKILLEDAIQIIEENNCLEELDNCNILITGATGMVGSYFMNTILTLNTHYNKNINLYLLVRNPNKLPDYVRENPNVNLIVQDVVDKINLDANIDYVIHAASPASPVIMKERPVETNAANSIGTYNTLLFANEKKTKGYLFISSREIYGEPREDQEFFYEDKEGGTLDHLVPRNGYAEGKKLAENLCACFKAQYGLNTKIVRLAHTYGPGMSIYDGRVQADFLKNVVYGEDILLKSDGSSVRSYTYIADAVSGMFKILLKSSDMVYNIGDENSIVSIKDLANTLLSLSDNEIKLVFDFPKGTNQGTASFTKGILSSEKARKELCWNPKYTLKEGFKRTLEYIKSTLQEDKLYQEYKKRIKK